MINQELYIHSPTGMYVVPPIQKIETNQLTNIETQLTNIETQLSNIENLACNSIRVNQIPDVGSASIISVPTGAKIIIDGREQVGVVTTAIINNIPPGMHSYKLTYPGYVNTEGMIYIEAGKTYNLFVIMERVPTSSNTLLYIGLFIVGITILSSRKKLEIK